jgi:hypothetical protein
MLNGNWVTGWYRQIGNYHYIFSGVYQCVIKPETLAIETLKLDSNGEMIFGNFELDGVMTKGGDVMEDYGGYPFPVVYSKPHCAFIMLSKGEYWSMLGDYREDAITIIGKQSEDV